MRSERTGMSRENPLAMSGFQYLRRKSRAYCQARSALASSEFLIAVAMHARSCAGTGNGHAAVGWKVFCNLANAIRATVGERSCSASFQTDISAGLGSYDNNAHNLARPFRITWSKENIVDSSESVDVVLSSFGSGEFSFSITASIFWWRYFPPSIFQKRN